MCTLFTEIEDRAVEYARSYLRLQNEKLANLTNRDRYDDLDERQSDYFTRLWTLASILDRGNESTTVKDWLADERKRVRAGAR